MPLKPLFQILVDEGYVLKDAFEDINESQKYSFGHILSGDYLPYDTMAQVLETHYRIQRCDLREVDIEPRAVALLDYQSAMKHLAVPIRILDGMLIAAMANPFNPVGLEDIFILTGHRVTPVFSKEKDIQYYIHKFYAPGQISNIASQFIVEENLEKNNYQLDPQQRVDIQNAPAVRLMDNLIDSAILYHASDIHIEPFADTVRTRYRIDGHLTTFQNVGISLLPTIISRLKIMSGMDISEKRLPQDGHFKIDTGRTIDFRTSTVPTIYGEKAVIRLIYNQGGSIDLHRLGFLAEDVASMQHLLNNPHGIILVTGPTGSGKTTTLAGFVNYLNKEDTNIVTVEDPVENIIPGVNQINVNPKAGLTFDNVLRAILRQDPDVIMIGEIRDAETATLAIRAAITGHLVLSTLHTNDAISAIIRLTDMGVAHYLVAAALTGIISQRLVRTICPYCKIKTSPTTREQILLKLPPDTVVYIGQGCPHCNNTGYHGRIAVYEYMAIDDTLRGLIDQKASHDEMNAALRRHGVKTIRENALANALNGNTTIEEMLKASYAL